MKAGVAILLKGVLHLYLSGQPLAVTSPLRNSSHETTTFPA